MDHYANWFVWTAGVDLALADLPANARIRRSIGPDKARRVLIVLADHADANGYAWPSIARIEDLTGLGRRTVTDGLSYLIAAGVIEKSGKVGRAVKYRLIKGRGLPDASTSLKGRDLPDAFGSEPSGESSGEVSGEPSGTARPEQEQEQNSPQPPAMIRPDLVAALEGAGISGDSALRAVLDIAASDPETIDAAGRLVRVPGFRRRCAEQYRQTEERLARERWDAAEKCPDCNRPLDTCARANVRLAAEDRCARLREADG